jgi:hypothetical protein
VSDFTERQHLLTPVERSREAERLVRAQRRRAVLRVCADAANAEDASLLLDVLGLDPVEGREESMTDVRVPIGAIRATTSWNDPGRTTRPGGKK